MSNLIAHLVAHLQQVPGCYFDQQINDLAWDAHAPGDYLRILSNNINKNI
jgi:hypothetical protein